MKLLRCSKWDCISWRPIRNHLSEGEMRGQIRNNIAEFLNAAFSPSFQLHYLTLEGGNPLPTLLGEAWSSHWARNSVSDRYPKVCLTGIFRGVKTPYFPSKFSQFPSEKESWCSLMEKGMLSCCCVGESEVCIDKGHTDRSIRQFLKPTAISSWAWLALAYIVP